MTQSSSPCSVTIIGLGLIGGSLARALQTVATVERVVGCVENDSDAATARELGIADAVTTDAAAAVAGADMVVLAVGIDAMGTVCRRIRAALPPQAIVTDVGSTKVSVIAAVRAALGAENMPRFVPGHPISGTEESGLHAGFDALFRGRRAILTPTEETRAEALDLVEWLWQAVGAHISRMAPEHHDEVLAATSHLPHLLAFTLVDTLAGMDERTEIFDYAAGGFADFTRIASSAPSLWTRIMFANDAAIMAALDEYIDRLQIMRDALQAGEDRAVNDCFTRAKKARDHYSARRGGS